jgi:hypothetical protein
LLSVTDREKQNRIQETETVAKRRGPDIRGVYMTVIGFLDIDA